jgi:flagellar motor switch protein FliN/FliY
MIDDPTRETSAVASDPGVLPVFSRESLRSDSPLFRLEDLAEVPLRVDVPLGALEVTIEDLLGLRVGSTLRLDRQTGEHLEIHVNGTPVARGEVRVHGERFAVRVTQILKGPAFDPAEGEMPHESPSRETD